MSDKAKFTDAAAARAFMTGGNATVTLVSTKTGTRFTYRLRANDEGDVFFVSLLGGPDNESDYRYMGRIARGVFWAGRKVPKPGDVGPDAPSSLAFKWAWERLAKGVLLDSLEIWHEGRCGRCARKLTVPASIASGFGPECAGKVGFSASWAGF
jgi:Family of unknown function (DUF6011)